MATQCVCGNGISKRPEGFKTTLSPCKCDEPGPGRRSLVLPIMGEFVFKKQYEQRKRLNLPIQTDTEIGMRKRHYSG